MLYPLLMLLWGSIAGVPPGEKAEPTLSGWVDAYSTADTYGAFANTLVLSLIRATLSVSLAVFFAWVLTRTDVPHRSTLQLLLIAPFALPPLVLTIAWALLASPNAGMLNTVWAATFGVAKGPFNVYSYGGLVWVGVLNFVSVKILLLIPAFNAMDATLEESSTMSGSSKLSTFMHVTVPLMLPAIGGVFILSLIRFMESFETELFLGAPAHIYVFTTQIYLLLNTFPVKYPQAMALAVSLLVLTFGMAALQARLLGGKRYTTVSGKSFRTHPTRLGIWRWPIFGLCVTFFIVAFLLPLLVLVLQSLAPRSGIQLDTLTLANYATLLQQPKMAAMLKNTVVLGVGVATVGMLLAAIIAYVIVRTDFRGKHVLDLLTWVPWTVPGIVLSVAMLWAYLTLPGDLYGTVWLLIIAVVTTTLPLGVRLMVGTQVQIARELEESSRVHGATWLETFFHVVLALVKRGFSVGWIILCVEAVRNLGVVLLLYGAASMPISIMIFVLFQEGQTGVVSAIAVVMLTLITVLLGVQMRLSKEPSQAVR
ncbi:MAG: iron ABC transporter permease [Chloroflexi bacterium]|nr:iron ABC transporter permease [Chloroflexota bacterium]